MICDCYKLRILPMIEKLELVSGEMFFTMYGYDEYQTELHDMILRMNMLFRCIDKCELKE